MAPSTNGQLQLLAGDSIYGGDLTISRSSAAPNSLASILHPAFQGFISRRPDVGSGNVSIDGNIARLGISYPLFAFGPNTASTSWGDALEPARFYALSGDLLAVNSGRAITITGSDDARFGQTYYEGAGAVRMLAGRDIVRSGTLLSGATGGDLTTGQYTFAGNLFVHNGASDISIASAGRDILYSSFNVAGPGTLEVTAGRNILMDDQVANLRAAGVHAAAVHSGTPPEIVRQLADDIHSGSLKDDFQATFCYNTRRFFNPFRQPENLK